ncbi:hypothetical protein MTR67_003567 [Solanum verrucosum]|uniref:OCT domain-containing protein n=1 Tax=Solanum verrucosum TaxID=315347 RepID=A0AAF0PSR4_SOLVR|nr:hypothetical protein MTR67_003567 [Solanum verrucosum]
MNLLIAPMEGDAPTTYMRRDPVNLNYVADMVKKQRNAPINEFEISHDSSSKTWYVQGLGLQRFVQMTNWRYMDSDRRFQHVLEACGVNKSLLKLGVKEGDTVVVGDMELEWHDYDSAGSISRRKAAENLIILYICTTEKTHVRALKFQII